MTEPYRAWLMPPRALKNPDRVVVVADPDEELLVRVWWTLRRGRPWRCTVHGRMDTPACVHADAALPLLERALFGARCRR